ncbi:hypothetical protein Pfo_014411 [Paulownia fortunei]|nr:hypothetical protein Pfo_014411 [Paulownia fortunei]
MELKLIGAVLFVLPFLAYNVIAEPVIYDITKYGAKPGADISKALLNAWTEACESTNASKVVIPRGTWTLSQARLHGPNNAPLELEVQGTVQAYSDINKLPNKKWEWVTINYVNYFTLSGGGVFDGQGQEAWKRNDCHVNQNCVKLPINLSFNFINNSIIHDVTTKDSKNFHVNCISSRNVTFLRFTISAPGESPNTDGIHLGRSSLINVTDSIIETGDDCVSIGDETKEVHIQNVTCGPGHGISVGSLGKSLAEKDVQGIYVKNCTFIDTMNGVRVKTWPSAPATLQISDLHFEDLIMNNVSNPIIIDQQYCPYNLCKLDKPSLIKISKISIKNIRGTSKTAEAVILVCSSRKPCENVEISDIDLTYNGNLGPITTKCANVKPTLVGKQNPPVCATTAQSA